jgi:hypothetical protein
MKRVVHRAQPVADGFEASCFDGHYITGDITPRRLLAALQAQRPQQGGEDDDAQPGAAGAAGRAGARRMNDDKNAPAELPEGLRRHPGGARGPARHAWGENSEALFLTSSFVHPDCATAAARFANEEEAFVYSRFSNPT